MSLPVRSLAAPAVPPVTSTSDRPATIAVETNLDLTAPSPPAPPRWTCPCRRRWRRRPSRCRRRSASRPSGRSGAPAWRRPSARSSSLTTNSATTCLSLAIEAAFVYDACRPCSLRLGGQGLGGEGDAGRALDADLGGVGRHGGRAVVGAAGGDRERRTDAQKGDDLASHWELLLGEDSITPREGPGQALRRPCINVASRAGAAACPARARSRARSASSVDRAFGVAGRAPPRRAPGPAAGRRAPRTAARACSGTWRSPPRSRRPPCRSDRPAGCRPRASRSRARASRSRCRTRSTGRRADAAAVRCRPPAPRHRARRPRARGSRARRRS